MFNDGRSKTVQIDFTAGNPRLAAAIANAHAEAYLHEQANRRGGSRQKSLDWLKQEVDRAPAKRATPTRAYSSTSSRTASSPRRTRPWSSSASRSCRRSSSTRAASYPPSRRCWRRSARCARGADPSNVAALLANDPLNDLLRSRVQAEAAVALDGTAAHRQPPHARQAARGLAQHQPDARHAARPRGARSRRQRELLAAPGARPVGRRWAARPPTRKPRTRSPPRCPRCWPKHR